MSHRGCDRFLDNFSSCLFYAPRAIIPIRAIIPMPVRKQKIENLGLVFLRIPLRDNSDTRDTDKYHSGFIGTTVLLYTGSSCVLFGMTFSGGRVIYLAFSATGQTRGLWGVH